MALALTASNLDTALLNVTGFTVTLVSIVDVIAACLSIVIWISSRKFLGNGMTVLLTSLSLGDLFIVPGGLAVIPILKGWTVLDGEMIKLTMALRDMPLMVTSVLQPLTTALICIQFYLQSTGNNRLSSGKISVGLAILAWLYAMFLVGAIVLYYGMPLEGLMGRVAVLQLPLTWLPANFLHAWHSLNVFVWVIVSITCVVLSFTRTTAVQPLNETATADTTTPPSPMILVVQVVFATLTWIPYSLYTGLVSIDLMAFTFKWIHAYNFFYALALICSVVRPIVTILIAPELKRKMMDIVKCKC